MKKLVVVLLLVSTSAWAEWTLVSASDKSDIYTDTATIRKRGNKVKMWTLTDYKSPQPVRNGEPILSIKSQYEFDCDEEQVRTVFLMIHAGHMGTGETVHSASPPEKWRPVPPGSVAAKLWKIACE